MDSRAKELISQGDNFFTKKQPLLSLWQEIADNFYPERADYTVTRSLGTSFADNLTTSYPILARRELGSLVSTMLRPSDQDWFHISVARDDKLDNEGLRWLEWATKIQKRAMYDRVAAFVRATKEGDNDFVSIGQCIISTELNRKKNALLYRCWHPRDVAWCENSEGAIDVVHRRWRPSARDAGNYFGTDKLHPKMAENLQKGQNKDPYSPCHVRHIIIPSDDYDTGSGPNGKRYQSKFVSIYVDVDNDHIIREEPTNNPVYTIPRWQTVSGSQYAYSPCTVAALPDARLIQAMTLVLLEAGEKATNPPMIATQDVVRSDINIMAGGVTWVDREYDEKTGDALRPMLQDFSGLPLGMELRNDIRSTIHEAFYLNKISMPPNTGREMTAFEVGQRVQEYVRNALPLFEPMETDYNGAICEQTFQVLFDNGAFGSRYDLPQSLRGQDVVYKFESPLHQTVEKQKGHTFMEAKAMLAEAVALDPSSAAMVDVKTALRDVLKGIQVPSSWVVSEVDMQKKEQAINQQAQTEQLLSQMQAGAGVAEQVGKASQALSQ